MGAQIYKCEKADCGFLFERIGAVCQCPDCGGTEIRFADQTEQEEYCLNQKH